MRELIVNRNDAGQRLDKFLSKTLRTMPPALMYKFIRLKKIKVNRARAQQNYMLSEGDRVQLFISDEFFEATEGKGQLGRIKPRLTVVYEDENILLADKRPGVLVHEDDDGEENTLLLHIKAYLYQKGEYDPESEQSFAPALCNRIDRNTGGIVIAAKNAAALRIMNEKIRDREIDKFYICAVHGIMPKKSDTVAAWLKKDPKSNMVTIYNEKEKPSDAKRIETRYRVISARGDRSLLEVELLTGRTHQIRAQLAALGHPLLGDGKYGVNRDDRREGYKYQALYAYRLKFSFKGESGELGYLSGREFHINDSEIWFVKDFYK